MVKAANDVLRSSILEGKVQIKGNDLLCIFHIERFTKRER